MKETYTVEVTPNELLEIALNRMRKTLIPGTVKFYGLIHITQFINFVYDNFKIDVDFYRTEDFLDRYVGKIFYRSGLRHEYNIQNRKEI